MPDFIQSDRRPFADPSQGGATSAAQGLRGAGGTALRIILASLFKNWRRILASMAAMLALTLVFVVMVKPSYVADSTLLVLLSSEYSPRAVGDDAKSTSIVLERDAVLKNEVEILTSSALEKETLRKIGLDRVYPDYLKPPGLFARIKARLSDRFQGLLASLGAPSPPARDVDPLDLAAQQFARELTATPDKAGNIIVVSYHNHDPAVAASVVNTLVDGYLARRQELLRDLQTEVLAGQVAALRAALDRAGHAYADFKEKNNISDYSTQRQYLLRQQSDTAQDLQQADRDVAQATQRVAVLQGAFDKLPKDVVQYRDSATVLARGRPVVLDTLDVDRSRAQQDLQAAKARHDTDIAQLAQLDEQLKSLDQKEFELERLDGQRKLVDENFRAVAKAYDDRALQEKVMAQKTANVRVIQAAETPVAPTSLRLMIFVAGALLSLFAGVLAAVLSNAFGRGYISPEAIEHGLGLPVLVAVPVLKTPPEKIAAQI